ncbi:MAG: phytanoyl-CoA dioxygenase family protein [bacterium]
MKLELERLKEQFDQDGFVVVRGLATGELLSEIRKKVPQAVQIAEEARVNADKDKPSSSRFAFTNVNKGLERIDPFFRNFLEAGPQLRILEALLGEPPTPTTAGCFSKDDPEEVVQPHRDGDNGATVWIALDPCGPANGCIYYLRGSHLGKDTDKQWELGDVDELVAHPEAIPVRLAPGDASIHYSKTIHWSGKNVSGAPRRGLNAFYQKMDGRRKHGFR